MSKLSSLAIVLLAVFSTSLVRCVEAIPRLTERSDPPLGIHRLPSPTGPYTIGTTNLILTDHTRLEIFSPTPNTTARTIVGQIYYPTLPADKLNKSGSDTFSPYLTPGLARWAENSYGLPSHALDGVLTNTYLNTSVSLPRNNQDSVDVVIFSPGYGASRSFYATYNEQLASTGYVVVAIEHLYDVDYVDIPGLGDFQNPYVNSSANSTEIINQMHAVRVQDALFILRSLADPQSQLVTGVQNLLVANDGSTSHDKDTWWCKHARVAMYGHSLGGSTSAGAMLADNTPIKLLGGINLDGTFMGPAVTNPPEALLDSPFLLFGHEGHNRTTDSSWSFVYDNVLKGWKRELALLQAQHLTFSDFPVIVDLLGLGKLLPPDVLQAYVGTIPGLRALQVVGKFVGAFIDWVVRGDESGVKLLDGVGREKWLEVQYLW